MRSVARGERVGGLAVRRADQRLAGTGRGRRAPYHPRRRAGRNAARHAPRVCPHNTAHECACATPDRLPRVRPARNRRLATCAAATPANLLTRPRGLWSAADAIWTVLGDKSTDFTWHTKHTILSDMLGATLVAWMGADDEAAVDDFLDRRIENVMQFEKFKAQAKDAFAKMPDPMDLFGQRK